MIENFEAIRREASAHVPPRLWETVERIVAMVDLATLPMQARSRLYWRSEIYPEIVVFWEQGERVVTVAVTEKVTRVTIRDNLADRGEEIDSVLDAIRWLCGQPLERHCTCTHAPEQHKESGIFESPEGEVSRCSVVGCPCLASRADMQRDYYARRVAASTA